MLEYDMVRKTVVMDEKLAEDIDLFARKEARDFSGRCAMPPGSVFLPWRILI